jgi:ubiquitin-protein ligase
MADQIINVPRNSQLLFVQKEINAINKNPILNKTTEFIIDDTDISRFNVLIKPNEGLYAGLSIPFELTVPVNYPAPGHPITAKCSENIYHPNIFSGGRLCLKYDGIGSLEFGFKETLENLIVALNYLFMHPENYGYGTDMPDHMKETIKQNIDAYRKRMKAKTKKDIGDSLGPSSSEDEKNAPLYRIREIYGTNINPSLEKIKDWFTYLPPSCTKEVKKSRYYMFTFSGRKIMDLVTLEDALSQIIHDPRYRFDTCSNIAFTKNCSDIDTICTPDTPYSIILSKQKRLVYPTDINMNPMKGSFTTDVVFGALLSSRSTVYRDDLLGTTNYFLKVFCNVVIRSNYNFSFVCLKKTDLEFPVLASQINHEKKGEYIMTIDQCLYHDKTMFDSHCLVINSEPDPIKPIWFHISYSSMTFGNDVADILSNVAFKLNPTDKTLSYVTLSPLVKNNISHYNNETKGLRLLTDEETKLVSKTIGEDDLSKKDENYYDIELASKYLASSVEDTGLDLRSLPDFT